MPLNPKPPAFPRRRNSSARKFNVIVQAVDSARDRWSKTEPIDKEVVQQDIESNGAQTDHSRCARVVKGVKPIRRES